MRVIWIALLIGPTSFAASIYKKALANKQNQYMTSGVFLGGEAGPGFTLLHVRRQASTKLGMERVVLDFGDRDGKPLLNRLGFFHVSVERNPARVVIDLSQTNSAKVTQAELEKMFLRSPYIKNVEFSMDAEDNAATLVLNTKVPLAAEVFQMPSNKKASRLVIDLKKIAR